MNLIEVIKLNQPFRRAFWGADACYLESPGDDKFYEFVITPADILADDWEVKPVPEVPITLTRTQFFQAVADVLKEFGYEHIMYNGSRELAPSDITGFMGWSELAKKLGFKESA